MTSEAEKSQKLTELRQRAEELLKKRQNLPPADWPEDFKKLFHELETHQIELEIQNEELRLAQEELSASREHFADLYDNSPAGYVTLSDKALIRRANLTFANMLGVPREWLSGRSLSEFVAHDDQDRLYLGCKTLLKEKKRHVMELRLQKRDGGPFWTRLECIPVPSGRQDGTINIRVVLTDITERKLAEEDLLQATDELKRSNEDFQQFAHVVSHDLQEPLRVVTLFLELL